MRGSSLGVVVLLQRNRHFLRDVFRVEIVIVESRIYLRISRSSARNTPRWAGWKVGQTREGLAKRANGFQQRRRMDREQDSTHTYFSGPTYRRHMIVWNILKQAISFGESFFFGSTSYFSRRSREHNYPCWYSAITAAVRLPGRWCITPSVNGKWRNEPHTNLQSPNCFQAETTKSRADRVTS